LLAALLVVAVLSPGCVSMEGGEFKVDTEPAINATRDLKQGRTQSAPFIGGNDSEISFGINSDFEKAYFERGVLVVRLKRVEDMDALAIVGPGGRKLQEMDVEPAQRRVEFMLGKVPEPGKYEFVKLDRSGDEERETGSVTIELEPEPVVKDTSYEAGTVNVEIENTGTSPCQALSVTVKEGEETVAKRQYTASGTLDVEGGDEPASEIVTPESGVILQPGATVTLQGPAVELEENTSYTVSVGTRYSGAAEAPLQR